MEITLTSSTWFDVEEDEKHVTIGTSTIDADYVTIRIKKRNPYGKHLKHLIKDLNELRDGTKK